MAFQQWQRLHGTRDPGLRDRPQSRPLLHSHSKPGIEWHLRELRQNLQARLCSREPSSGCDHRTPADRRMVLGLQRKPSPFWAQNALPKGVHASSITIALCPVKRGQLHVLLNSVGPGMIPKTSGVAVNAVVADTPVLATLPVASVVAVPSVVEVPPVT